jgi:hypothetical protein
MCLTTICLTWPSITCKNLARTEVDGVLIIMQRYIKGSGISIKTHFASHQNDRLNFPLTFDPSHPTTF